MSVLITRGEHLRADLHTASGVGEEQGLDSISTKLKPRGGHTEDRPMLLDKPTVSGRKLLTPREVLPSSLHEAHSDGSHNLKTFTHSNRSIRILHMHIPKTAGGAFERDVSNNSAWAQFRKLAYAARRVDAMKSSLDNFTSENARKPLNVSNATESNLHNFTLENAKKPLNVSNAMESNLHNFTSETAKKPLNVSHAMESKLHNFTSVSTRKPVNVSHVSNQSEMNLTIDDRDGQFPIAADIYLSNQSETNSTVDDLYEQFEVATDLFEALAKRDGLNSTSIEIAPGWRRALSVSQGEELQMKSKEACLEQFLGEYKRLLGTNRTNKQDTFLVTLLREPVAQVQSMYLKCKHNWKSRRLLPEEKKSLRDISSWVAHYNDIKDKKNQKKWSCYNPANIQTRAFSCTSDLWHDDVPGTSHTFEHAAKRMEMFDFVGITERFHESLCVFSAVVTSRAPAWCNCSNTAAWASFVRGPDRSGTYPNHKTSDLNAQQLESIQRLTSEDDKLYKFATQRFDAQIAQYEAKGILKLSC